MKKKIIFLGIVLILLISIIFAVIWYKKLNNNETTNTDEVVKQTDTASLEKRDGKYGIVNSKGNVIVPFEYDEGYDYKNGIAVLKNEKGSTYFNENGNIIGFPNTALDGPVKTYSKDDYLAFKDTNTSLYGFINNEGTVALPAMWRYVTDFCNGLALVGDDTGTYVIDKSGNMIVSQKILSKYASINPAFENELLIVYDYNQFCGVIDINGKEIVKCDKENTYIEVTDENIAVHKGETIAYYDFKGNEI